VRCVRLNGNLHARLRVTGIQDNLQEAGLHPDPAEGAHGVLPEVSKQVVNL